MGRKKRRKNPATSSTPWFEYALIAGGAYLILRELRRRGSLGNGDYGVKPVAKPAQKQTMVQRITSSLPWYARAGLTVAKAVGDTGAAVSSAAKWAVLPGSVAPDWKASNADLIARLQQERYARQKATQEKPLFTIQDVQNIYGAAKKISSDVRKAYDAIKGPMYVPLPVTYGPEDISKMREALAKGQEKRAEYAREIRPDEEKEMERQAVEILESYAVAEKAAENLREEEERAERIRKQNEELDRQVAVSRLSDEEYIKLREQQRTEQGLPPAPQGQASINWDALAKKFLTGTFAPGFAANKTMKEVTSRVGKDVFNAEEQKAIAKTAYDTMQRGLESGRYDPMTLETDPNVKKDIGSAVGLTTMEILKQKADRNELSVEAIVNLDKAEREASSSFWKKLAGAVPEATLVRPPELGGDANTLANMRAARVLKQKLDEETLKVQEEGYAPYTENGKTKWKKIDLRDSKNLEDWRRQRADEMVAEYRRKVQPKLDAEKKATEEFIAKRSPAVAAARDLISKGIKDKAPRMTPATSDDEALKAFQQKYGDNPGKPNSELTTDSYMGLIRDYAEQMEKNLSSGGEGAATEGALGFILNDLKSNIDVLLPVFTQAADPTLDQKERFDRLKKFASALDALTLELAERSVPKFLATRPDAEIVAMMNQGVSSNLAKHLETMRGKRMEEEVLRDQPVTVFGGGSILGLDDVAAMEFGPKRRRA